MRFLFVDRKGAASIWGVISPLAADLVKDGHAVLFARLDDGSRRPPTPVPEGVEVRDVAVPPKSPIVRSLQQQAAFGRRFRSLLCEVRPHLVHTNFCVPGVVARAVASISRVPRIVSTQHELFGSMNPLYRLAVRLTEHQADATVYVSHAVARSFGRSPDALDAVPRGGRAGRHVVIHNGVDTGFLDEVRRGAGPVEKGKLVCVGRLIDVKGQRLLIEAMPAVLRERPDARLVLAGQGPDEKHLRALVAAAGLSDEVVFRGWLPHRDALRVMATAEVAVLPSLPTQEGFGLALVEAMGLGVPVVASRIPVFEEVAGEMSGNVRLFDGGDPTALAQELLGVLHRPSAERVPDPRVERMFSVRRMVDRYRSLYEMLVPGARRAPAETRLAARAGPTTRARSPNAPPSAEENRP